MLVVVSWVWLVEQIDTLGGEVGALHHFKKLCFI